MENSYVLCFYPASYKTGELQGKTALEKTFRNLDVLGTCRHALTAVASPSGNIGIIPVREITQFQSKSESLYPYAPRPPDGGLVVQEGKFIQKKRRSIENCIKQM
jgi:hypothetical protein